MCDEPVQNLDKHIGLVILFDLMDCFVATLKWESGLI